MGRDVLFSFLGTNDYVPVRYSLRGAPTSTRETFVQCALVRSLKAENRPVDLAILAMTKEAKDKHSTAIRDQLQSLELLVQALDIPTGNSEEELWEIFKTIGTAFQRDDRVVFDLTHGFRSLPSTGLLAMSYFRHVLGIDVQVYYGAFEVLGSFHDVKQRHKDNDEAFFQENIAPIFDLTPMFVLPAWAEAVAEWKRTGRASGLVQQSQPHTAALQRALKREAPRALTGLPQDLKMLSDALMIMRHDSIGARANEVIEHAEEAKEHIEKEPRLAPLTYVLDQVRDSVEPLRGNGGAWQDYPDSYLRHQLQIVRWLSEHNRIVEAFSFLRELVISGAVRILKNAGIEEIDGFKPSDVDFREKAGGICAYAIGAKSDIKEKEIGTQVKAWLQSHPSILENFRDASQITQNNRNRLDHCWMGEEHGRQRFTKSMAETISKDLERAITAADRLLHCLSNEISSNYNELQDIGPGASALQPCFINLSNHPIDTWSEAQRQGALELGLGTPVELAGGMPLVPPEAGPDDIAKLAEDIVGRAMKQGVRGAFVAGEFTLTYALIQALCRQNIRCFTATTKRQASEVVAPDGSVTRSSVFAFVRWREYV